MAPKSQVPRPAPKSQVPRPAPVGTGDKTTTTTTTCDKKELEALQTQVRTIVKTQYEVTSLNHSLTRQLNDAKDQLKKAEDDHWNRINDLHTQIHAVQQKYTDKNTAWQTEFNKLKDHYAERKEYWTKRHDDDQKTIADQKHQLDALATTVELMAKRQRT